MKASHFSEDIQEFLRLLFIHEVHYVIVGGEAVIYHGHARLTGDVDIHYKQETTNVERLFHALSDFWDGDIPEIAAPADLLVPDLILQFGVPPNRLDLLGSISGVSFDEAWGSRVEEKLEIRGQTCSVYFIGKDMLVRNKNASGRAKDRDDLRYL
jgi:hypothetical protein